MTSRIPSSSSVSSFSVSSDCPVTNTVSAPSASRRLSGRPTGFPPTTDVSDPHIFHPPYGNSRRDMSSAPPPPPLHDYMSLVQYNAASLALTQRHVAAVVSATAGCQLPPTAKYPSETAHQNWAILSHLRPRTHVRATTRGRTGISFSHPQSAASGADTNRGTASGGDGESDVVHLLNRNRFPPVNDLEGSEEEPQPGAAQPARTTYTLSARRPRTGAFLHATVLVNHEGQPGLRRVRITFNDYFLQQNPPDDRGTT